MTDCLVGSVVTAIMGHDAGERFLVIKEDDAYVYLCDGRKRTIANPKKKKKKHVEVCGAVASQELVAKLTGAAKVYDHEVIHALKIANN